MKNEKTNAKNVTGIILTIIITIWFIWAISQLSGPSREQKPITPETMQLNEIAAYENLKALAAAQESYIRRDWDKDGKKTYAIFYVHLWRSVSKDSQPIEVNLIPKELAFAMEVTNPLEGYYYLDIRKRLMEGRKGEAFDYGKEWAIAAIPADRRRVGVLTFITDQTGVIYVTPGIHTQPEYPHDPEANGWTRLNSLDDLKKFQQTVSYPD